jgi:hypothetical protein
MDDQVRRIQPQDPEIAEEWLRKTNEPDIRAVSAAKITTLGGWHVSAWVMQHVRSGPLAAELEQCIPNAVAAVSGVSSIDWWNPETLFVTGAPSGKALVEAAAQVVDDLADQTRAYIRPLYGEPS